MNYRLPEYISDKHLESNPINYRWDDSRVYESIPPLKYGEYLTQKMQSLSLRAKIVIAIGIYEWILGRLGSYAQDNMAKDFAEAAWCASVDKHYIQYIVCNRDNYLGPIDGVLWCGFMSVAPLLYVSNHISAPNNPDPYTSAVDGYDPDLWQQEIPFLIMLVIHILPASEVSNFKTWLETVINRFHHLFPEPKDEEPLANLFGYADEREWLGDYIAREALDIDEDYFPEQTTFLINHFLSEVNRNNPLLKNPNQLQIDIETPFQLNEPVSLSIDG